MAAVAVTGCLLIPLTACATHVVDFATPYYKDGPQQVSPPDGFLKRGEKIWVFGELDGYSRFFSESGEVGFVWPGSLVSPSRYEEQQQAMKQKPPPLFDPPPDAKQVERAVPR
jgi:hypothetical protein